MGSKFGKIALTMSSRAAAIISILAATLYLSVYATVHVDAVQFCCSVDFETYTQILFWLGAASIGVGIFALVIFLYRYLRAAQNRIRLDKNDIYFIVALLFGIVTFLIGHYWR